MAGDTLLAPLVSPSRSQTILIVFAVIYLLTPTLMKRQCAPFSIQRSREKLRSQVGESAQRWEDLELRPSRWISIMLTVWSKPVFSLNIEKLLSTSGASIQTSCSWWLECLISLSSVEYHCRITPKWVLSFPCVRDFESETPYKW